MILASVNCNKRLGNAKALKRLEKFLVDNTVDVVVVQEPWTHKRTSPVDLLFYRPLGGNSRVFAWAREGYEIKSSQIIQPYWQCLRAGYVLIHNVYLDAYKRITRGQQLTAIEEGIAKLEDRPHVIVGDFNLAPAPEDGLSGDSPSRFNGVEDREPFKRLLERHMLVDTTSKENGGKQEFTIARNISDIQIRFRCDLCLVSDYLFATRAATVSYDHSTRAHSTGFTDHSALVVDLPVTLPRSTKAFQTTLFPLPESNHETEEFEYSPHKTAISRSSPSPAAKLIGEGSFLRRIGGTKRILDYGCGRGRDVDYLHDIGLNIEGYDPNPSFGFATPPTGLFDLVSLVFVVNVLPNCWERLEAVRQAARYLRPGGYMLLVARSFRTIEMEAKRKGWKQHNDGYWSHEGKGTFQRGITPEEMISIVEGAGLTPHPATKEIRFDSATSHLLAWKPINHAIGEPLHGESPCVSKGT